MDTERNIPFSAELEQWLRGNQPKTLRSLDHVFAEKSFAAIFTLLLAFSALPVPTGGLSHAFGLIAFLIALQVVIGRRSLWIPKRWQSLHISPTLLEKFIPKVIRLIRWLEKYSRPRLNNVLQARPMIRFYGLAVAVFAATVAVTPPFSGLDTLPSLGVVLMSLAIMLEDFLLFIVGLIVGAAGVTLMLVVGKAAFELLTRFF